MSIKRNIIYNTILSISNVLYPVITTPYVARILGVENMGVISFVTTYTAYFTVFASLGVQAYGLREIAKHHHDPKENQRIFSELFVITLISTGIVSIVYVLTIFSIPVLHQNRKFLLIAGISLICVPFNVDWFFSGREQFKLITIRSLAIKLITIAGLFILVRKRDDSIFYLILMISSNVVNQLWSFGYLLLHKIKIQWKNLKIKNHFTGILILFISRIVVSVYTMLPVLMLGFMSDYIQVSYYALSDKITKLLLPIVTSMSSVMIARINIMREKEDSETSLRLLNRSFELIMLLAVPTSIGLASVASHFVPFFFGLEFIPAVHSLQLLSFVIIIIGLSNFFGWQILIAMGHEKSVLLAPVMGMITNFCLNLVLIGKFGSFGASIAYVIAELIVSFMTILLSLRVIPFRINSKHIIYPLIGAIPILPVSYFFNRCFESHLYYLLATIITSAVAYITIMTLIARDGQVNHIVCSGIAKIQKMSKSRLIK